MSLFVGTIFISITLFVVLLFLNGFKFNKKQLLAFLPLLLCVFNFFTIIPPNSVGVQYSPFTGVKEETLSEGIHTKGFFDKIYVISTEVQTKTIKDIIGQTKDAQYITMVLDVKYQVNPANAFKVFRQFRTLENVNNSLIIPVVQRSVETITTQYDVIEILGNKRNDVYKGIEVELKERLAQNGINLHSITMIDTDAGDAIEKAIQDEAVAKKQVETAEQLREKARIEAEQKVIEAEAQAKTKIIEAEAQAQAYKIVNEQLTPEVLKKIWIDKWDGKLPQVVSDDNNVLLGIKGEN